MKEKEISTSERDGKRNAKTVAKNTLANSIGYAVKVIATLLIVPATLHFLGQQKFAVWALASTFTGYFGLLDLGIGPTFIRYLAKYHAEGDERSINSIVSTGIILYLLLMGASIATWLLISKPVAGMLNIPTNLRDTAILTILGALIILFIQNIGFIFKALLDGVQRMDLSNTVTSVSSVVQNIGFFLVLKVGFGLPGLVSVGIATATATLFTFFAAARFKLPSLQVHPHHVSRKAMRELLSFGWKMQIINVGTAIDIYTDKIIIASFLSLTLVAQYEIGTKIVTALTALPIFFFGALMPMASTLSIADKAELRRVYKRGQKYVMAVIVGIFLFVITAADPLIKAWVGEGFETSVLVLRLLALGMLVNATTGVGTTIIRGIGMPEKEVRYSVTGAILNVVLTLILTPFFGLYGILGGTVLAMSVSSLYFHRIFHKTVELAPRPLVRKIYLPIASAGVVAAISSLLTRQYVLLQFSETGRLLALFELASMGFVFALTYLSMIVLSGYFDTEEKATLARILPKRLRLKAFSKAGLQ